MVQVKDVHGSAWISNDGLYRYELIREWQEGNGSVLWIMLNPSTADALNDDPTIRRVVGFTHRWGYNRAVVVNLFAYRTKDPRKLLALPDGADPVGPETDGVIRRRVHTCELIVAAWGSSGSAILRRRMWERARIVDDLIGLDHAVACLGMTSLRFPRHPLYVPAKTQPQEYDMDVEEVKA